MKKTIAFIVNFFPFSTGGAELQSYQIANYLKEEYDIHFASVSDKVKRLEKVTYENITIWLIPKKKLCRRIFNHDQFLNYKYIKYIFEEIHPNYVYQRCVGFNTWTCAKLKKHFKYRFILHVANDQDVQPAKWGSPYSLIYKIEKFLVRRTIKFADKIFVQNKFQQLGCENFFNRNDSQLVYNFSSIESHPIHKDSHRFVICWVANIKPIKNPKAYTRIVQAFSNDSRFIFFMIGTPPKEKDMKFIKETEKQNKNFHFLGAIPNEKVNEYLRSAHILINTSDNEGFSNVFVQALFRGCAVVSLNANPDNILNEYKIGFCANGEEQKIIDYLRAFAESSSLRNDIYAQTIKFAQSYLSDTVILPIIKKGILD